MGRSVVEKDRFCEVPVVMGGIETLSSRIGWVGVESMVASL